MQENQSLWRSRRSIATVRSKSEVKQLILKHFELVVDFLMHISGLIQYPNIFLSDKDACIKSLLIYSKYKIDYADAFLVSLVNLNTGSNLFTFDKKLLKILSEITP